MAEQIPYGVAVSLVNKLASLAFRELGRIYGFSEELDKLRTTVEFIQAKISDAEESQQHQDRGEQIWIRRLRQVVQDSDDLFDELVIYDLRRKVNAGRSQVRDLFSSKNQLFFRSRMARRIESIRQSLDGVSNDVAALNLRPSIVVSNQNEIDWRETSSFVLQSDIIGREENKNDIVNLLKQTHTNDNVSLIAIVGMGGLGKTALAQLVYNDAEVQKRFQKHIWVCVSKDFEEKSILHKMLKSLDDSVAMGGLELEQIQKKLQAQLNGQRYLLVLDDVWDDSLIKWTALRNHLMCGGEGSKILVTTCSTSVAQTMGINNPYVLQFLTTDQSWALLRNLVFDGDDRRISPNLVPIGEKIAEKCGGVPLAIKTIGGLLHSTNEKGDWLNILNGDFWKQCGAEKRGIMPVLKLSYLNLPLALRQCFVYCSLYPKDWKFEKDELIQLWLAQGYLENSIEMQSMEDVGNRYVKNLLMRSFFQDASMNSDNNKVYFKMHDLMHDLAKSVAGNDFYLSQGKEINGSPMHLSFVSASSVCPLDSLGTSKLRTVLGPKTEVQLLANPSIIKKFKYVRVLDLSCSTITMLPNSIDKLKHLRYLDLSFCKELSSLPESIGNLVCLQTLKLRCCKKLVFGVEVITKLISLRHLDIERCKAFDDMMPVGLGKLTSLQSLSKFVVGENRNSKSGKLNELKDLNNLRGHLRINNLGIIKDVKSESQEVNLKAKASIQHLELYWGEDEYDYEVENINSESLELLNNLCPHENLEKLTLHGYPGVQFSSWLPSLANIVEINLFHFFYCQDLPPLERLQCLKTLQICNMKELEHLRYVDMSGVIFRSLERLILYDCKNLRGWQRIGDIYNGDDTDNHPPLPPFPRLSYLHIDGCPKLTCMPTFPHLVEMLHLRSCSVKPMIDTCLVQLQSPSNHPLSALKHLHIAHIDIEKMPMQWMQYLTSLERLSVSGSPIIAAVLRHLRQT